MLLASLFLVVGTAWAQGYFVPGERKSTFTVGDEVLIYSTCRGANFDYTGFFTNANNRATLTKIKPSSLVADQNSVWIIEHAEPKTTDDGKEYYYVRLKNKATDGWIGIGGVTNNGTHGDPQDFYVSQWKTGITGVVSGGVMPGDDVFSEDKDGNQLSQSNITAEDPLWVVQAGTGYCFNTNGGQYQGSQNVAYPIAFYEAKAAEITNALESNKVYRIINKANAGKVIAENTSSFKLHVPASADDDKSQLWYVEGDDILGYTFRNLKSADYMNFVDGLYTLWGTTDQPVPFYLTKVEEADGETPAYFAIALRSDAKLHEEAYAHYSNGNVVRWKAKESDAANAASTGPSLWQIEEVSIDALAALDASYNEWTNEFNQTIAEAKTLMTTTAGFSISPVDLTTDNTTCPAEVPADGGDGDGVAALLDDVNDTYMHTKYPQKGSYGEHHYIQVDLGKGKSAKYITFSYRARHNNQNNNPETMIIKGSVDGEIYTDIQTLTNLPDGLVEYESPVVGNGTAYRYFRFVVTETTNNAKNGDYVFFALGKFRMNTVAVNDNYASKASVLGNLKKIVDNYTVAETRPADWCLKAANQITEELDELVYGATLREYPFTLTTDVNAPVCYQILSGRGNANTSYYFTLKPNDGGKVKLETTTKDNVYSYWFFMEEPATGKLMVVPFMEESMPLGYVAVADGDSKLTNVHSTQNFAGYHYEVIEYSGVNGFPYALKPYKANTNVSNHGGTGNFMGFYNGAADGGSAVKFEVVDCPAIEFRSLPAAIATANSKCPGSDRTGTMLNGYSEASVNAYKAAVANVEGLYNAASTTAETINEHKNTLNNLYSVLEINLPEDGKFYRVRCSDGNRRILSTLTAVENKGDRLALANTVTDESIFCYTNGALVSYQEGLSINASNYNNVGAVSNVVFSKAVNKVLGCYNVKVGDRWIYGSGDYIDSGSGTTPDQRNGYNWWLEEVTELPVVVTAAGYATLYAPVALTIPAGVKAYTGTVKGDYLTLNAVEGTIPANTGVILEAPQGTYKFAVTADVDAIEGNALTGSAPKSVKNADKKVYTLQNGSNGPGLYRFNGVDGNGNTTYINGFRAWVELDAAAAVNALRITRGDETGIDQIISNDELVIYDLAGRRVEKMEKGIYIVNGKKVVIK